jgi:hypothetical protein
MDESTGEEVSRLLEAVQRGDRSALDNLYTLVYGELRLLAHRQRRAGTRAGRSTRPRSCTRYLKLRQARTIHLQTRAHSSHLLQPPFDTSSATTRATDKLASGGAAY